MAGCGVRTCYGYESYLEARYIGEEPQGEPWMVLSPWADVLAAPKHQAQILLTLPRGSRVRAWGGENRGWVRIALPGGGGRVRQGSPSGPFAPAPGYGGKPAAGQAGGRGPGLFGLPLSVGRPYPGRGGLQRPVPYRLPAPGNPHLSQFPSGAWLWGPGDPREACQAGDLLYFPGHMAMYLGGDRFVHASARAGKVCCGSLRDNAEGYWADLAERLFCIGSIFPL